MVIHRRVTGHVSVPALILYRKSWCFRTWAVLSWSCLKDMEYREYSTDIHKDICASTMFSSISKGFSSGFCSVLDRGSPGHTRPGMDLTFIMFCSDLIYETPNYSFSHLFCNKLLLKNPSWLHLLFIQTRNWTTNSNCHDVHFHPSQTTGSVILNLQPSDWTNNLNKRYLYVCNRPQSFLI